jgi:hypothetical protein
VSVRSKTYSDEVRCPEPREMKSGLATRQMALLSKQFNFLGSCSDVTPLIAQVL